MLKRCYHNNAKFTLANSPLIDKAKTSLSQYPLQALPNHLHIMLKAQSSLA
ncbi:hypothetical protein [Helicobacter marmotae]|uniref:hypothetical protein n=1 Tax=Helicobacter marmotae TaxID=152490 RepID=UPI0014754376|nr:hypothetical protein [Helicobacter marmotae]